MKILILITSFILTTSDASAERFKSSFKSKSKKKSTTVKKKSTKYTVPTLIRSKSISNMLQKSYKAAEKKCPTSYQTGPSGVVQQDLNLELEREEAYKLYLKNERTIAGRKVCGFGAKNGYAQFLLYIDLCGNDNHHITPSDGLAFEIWTPDRIHSASAITWDLKKEESKNRKTYCTYEMRNGTPSMMEWTVK